MKKTLRITAAAFALLLALTGCTGTRNTNRSMTADQSYTADESGRTNEAGDNGITTGSNSTATNGTDRKRTVTTDDTAADRMERGTRSGTVTETETVRGDGSMVGTVQDGSSAAARGVRRAVDGVGNVVDDVAYGAANIVDDATDAVTGDNSSRRETAGASR